MEASGRPPNGPRASGEFVGGGQQAPPERACRRPRRSTGVLHRGSEGTMSDTWKRWQDWATVVVGVLLFITPFVFGATADTNAAYTAYAGGVLLAIAGLWNLAQPTNSVIEWAEV